MATVKQKLAVKKVLRGTTLKRAMQEAGYKETTASTTGKLTRSKGWKELIDKFISDTALLKVHKEGLSATRSVPQISGRDSKGAPEYEYVTEADFAVRHKYLETGYKIKGKVKEAEMPIDRIPHMTLIQINLPNGTPSHPVQPQS